jgi:hypothetical protein
MGEYKTTCNNCETVGEIIMGDQLEARGQHIGTEVKMPHPISDEAARLIAEIQKIDIALARRAPFPFGEARASVRRGVA